MDKIENVCDVQDDVLVLGVASVETAGMRPGNTELVFIKEANGISEE